MINVIVKLEDGNGREKKKRWIEIVLEGEWWRLGKMGEVRDEG